VHIYVYIARENAKTTAMSRRHARDRDGRRPRRTNNTTTTVCDDDDDGDARRRVIDAWMGACMGARVGVDVTGVVVVGRRRQSRTRRGGRG
jgi:hypothetical protein